MGTVNKTCLCVMSTTINRLEKVFKSWRPEAHTCPPPLNYNIQKQQNKLANIKIETRKKEVLFKKYWIDQLRKETRHNQLDDPLPFKIIYQYCTFYNDWCMILNGSSNWLRSTRAALFPFVFNRLIQYT